MVTVPTPCCCSEILTPPVSQYDILGIVFLYTSWPRTDGSNVHVSLQKKRIGRTRCLSARSSVSPQALLPPTCKSRQRMATCENADWGVSQANARWEEVLVSRAHIPLQRLRPTWLSGGAWVKDNHWTIFLYAAVLILQLMLGTVGAVSYMSH